MHDPGILPGETEKKSQVMSIRTSGIQSKQASAGNKCQWLITTPQLSKSSGFISVTCDYLFIYLLIHAVR
jgi:hypothetical protein